MYGWSGATLEIDLSRHMIEKKDSDPTLNRNYLGGRGINTRLVWDRVPPEVDPYSAENLLIFGTGLLAGTLAPGANRTVITTRSPQTNLLTYSGMGGFWAPELKQAGYDTLVISGKAETPVYLWICDDSVEIRDARHLWGKDTRATRKIIEHELDNRRIQVLCIGPAGENRVFASAIQHSGGASASRSVAPVMGDKNLKAVVVYGTKDINIAHPDMFHTVCNRILKKTDALTKYYENWSHEVAADLVRVGAYGNMEEERPTVKGGDLHKDLLRKYTTRGSSCFNCAVNCKPVLGLPNGEYSVVKCQSWFLFMFATKIQDMEFNLQCYHLCDKYGLDSISTANCMAFAIDLYEKGLLTSRDTDGMHLTWGSKEVALSLIEKIAKREGIGTLLAKGVREAARTIGNGAEDYAYHVKGLELGPYIPNNLNRALRTAVNDKADLTRMGGGIPRNALTRSREWKEAYVKSGFFPYPKAWKEIFMGEDFGLGDHFEELLPFLSYDMDRYTLCDCTGLCIYWTGFWLYNPIQHSDHVEMIRYATGIDLDEADSMIIAKRINALNRVYNALLGIRRKDDSVPEKFFRDTAASPFATLDRAQFNRMIDSFYELRGWNSEGIPTKQNLGELGLEFAGEVLESRKVI